MFTCAVRSEKNVRMRAYGEVSSVHPPPVAFMAVATAWTRNCQVEQKWEVRKTTNGIRIQVNLTTIETVSL